MRSWNLRPHDLDCVSSRCPLTQGALRQPEQLSRKSHPRKAERPRSMHLRGRLNSAIW